VERWNRLHPEEEARVPWVTARLADRVWPVIAATDYVKAMADQVARWFPGGMVALGTDGFGRSEERPVLLPTDSLDPASA
jgi:pyruvate dehydrogenase E1 component